jgi:hypothetical protein
MSIWSDIQINRAISEAEKQIAAELRFDATRISIPVVAQFGLYDLPEDCIAVRRVLWLGKVLIPRTFDEIILDYPFLLGDQTGAAFEPLAYTVAFALNAEQDYVPVSEPTHYIYTDFGRNQIRLYPTPASSVAQDNTNLWGSNIGTTVIVEYISADATLPNYIPKRLKRYIVLSKLFAIEGPGQDMEASEYYGKRSEMLLFRSKSILSKIYRAQWNGSTDEERQFKSIIRPVLPSNYGRIVRG